MKTLIASSRIGMRPTLLEAERLVEGDGAVDVADAVAGVDELGHGRAWTAIDAVACTHDRRALAASAVPVEHLPRRRGRAARRFFVDAGGPVEPLIEAAERHGMTPTHVLLTHHHYDHVGELDALLERWPDIEVLIHPAEREHVAGATGDDARRRRRVHVGDLEVDAAAHARATPPGCSRCSSRATSSPATRCSRTRSAASARRATRPTRTCATSIMDTLMALPPETVVRPGHTDPSTIGDEFENNAFVRVWRGLDPEGDEPCTALGEPATLVLLGDDYDGGHKAWVRWPDGRDDIVPGSQVQRRADRRPVAARTAARRPRPGARRALRRTARSAGSPRPRPPSSRHARREPRRATTRPARTRSGAASSSRRADRRARSGR